MKLQTKKDLTRLKNLLSKYQSHITINTRLKNGHLYPSYIKEKVNKSIRTIEAGL